MSGRADNMLPVHDDTKELIDERKPDGMTYDLWIRRAALGIETSE
jgi:hypothetical protein